MSKMLSIHEHQKKSNMMKKSVLLSAMASTFLVFSVAANAASDSSTAGVNTPSEQTSTSGTVQTNQSGSVEKNSYAATPAQPNGDGAPATPAVPGNPTAAKEVKAHRKGAEDALSDNSHTTYTTNVEHSTVEKPTVEKPTVEKPTVEKPTIERPTIERPTIERPTIERPTIERPTIERPTIERPTIERPTIERPDIQVPSFHR